VSAGALPAGLALSSGGALSGTPTTAGAYHFTVSLTDGSASRVLSGPTLLEAAGTSTGPPGGWSSPKTNFGYRLSGTAVGKNNHNLPPAPPSGDPSGTLDPNLGTISYFRMPASGTVTIDGTFASPMTASAMSSEGGQFLEVGLINQGWVDYSLNVDGYSSRMFGTPNSGANGNAYLLVYRAANNLATSMEEHEGANATAADKRVVASIASFSIQYQAGLDKNGNAVGTGGRMRYALDGGAYGAWDNQTHDFVGQNTALELAVFTYTGTVSVSLGDVRVTTAKDFDLTITQGALAADPIHPPARTFMAPAFPSPFTQSTTIRFGLEREGTVDLAIFDLFGREVRRLLNGVEGAGYSIVQWDGRGDEGLPLPAGVYLIRLRANGVTQTGRVRLVR
jgi:hypothetical protein